MAGLVLMKKAKRAYQVCLTLFLLGIIFTIAGCVLLVLFAKDIGTSSKNRYPGIVGAVLVCLGALFIIVTNTVFFLLKLQQRKLKKNRLEVLKGRGADESGANFF